MCQISLHLNCKKHQVVYFARIKQIDSSETTRSVPANFSNIEINRKILGITGETSQADCITLLNRIKTAAPALGSISLHDYK
jgi:hypothetical protein